MRLLDSASPVESACLAGRGGAHDIEGGSGAGVHPGGDGAWPWWGSSPCPHTAGAERGIRVGQAAPEITGGPWVNSAPLSLGALRGRVVFVEFWTYG